MPNRKLLLVVLVFGLCFSASALAQELVVEPFHAMERARQATINTSPPQALIADEDLKSITPPTMALGIPMATGRLPSQGHWAMELNPGGSHIKNGVLWQRGPDIPPNFFLAGVPEQPPEQLLRDLEALESYSLPKSTRARTMKQFSEWMVDQYQGLSVSDRLRLKHLYRRTIKNALRRSHDRAELPVEERKQQLKRLASDLYDFLSKERQILKKSESAQMLRYGQVLVTSDTPNPDIEDRVKIEKTLLRFLQGEYIEDEKRLPSASPNILRPGQDYQLAPTRRAGSYSLKQVNAMDITQVHPDLSASGEVCHKLTPSQLININPIQGPEVLGFVGKVFVAEHLIDPATSETWEFLGWPSIYHTSIVAGVWYIEHRTEQITESECKEIGQKPVRTVRQREVTTEKFDNWILANGCTGTYRYGDLLGLPMLNPVIVKAEFGDGSFARILQWLTGSTLDAAGHQCRTRFGSYPIGAYGTDFVCHQACNSYAFAKWRVLPVVRYFESLIFFGNFGALGVSDNVAPCNCPDTTANHPCIPGNYCCWAYIPFGLGDGWGYGLSGGWHESKGWIDTEFKYTPHDIPIPGWNLAPSVHYK